MGNKLLSDVIDYSINTESHGKNIKQEQMHFSLEKDKTLSIKEVCKGSSEIESLLLATFLLCLHKYCYQEEINLTCLMREKNSYKQEVILSKTPPPNEKVESWYTQVKQKVETVNISSKVSDYINICFEFNNQKTRYLNSNYNFSLYFNFSNNIISGIITYNPLLFNKTYVTDFKNNFLTLLSLMIENKDYNLSDLCMIDDSVKNKIIGEFNNTFSQPNEKQNVKERFENIANTYAHKTAVIFSDKSITYKDLNEKANGLAYTLCENGIKKGDVVAVIADKSIEAITSLIAIIKAGAVYLPIDIEYPKARVEYMLKDSNTKLVLADSNSVKDLCFAGTYINIDNILNEVSPRQNLNIELNSSSLAYIIYTSGTTGNPKGVLVNHKGINRLVINPNYMTIKDSDVFVLTGSFTFDVSTFEIWGPLLNGLELHLLDKDTVLSSQALKEYVNSHNISIMWLTSQLFNNLCEQDSDIFNNLKYLLVGGDVVSPMHVNKAFTNANNLTVVNGYGPTENTTFSVCHVMNDKVSEEKAIPIGRPISNSTAFILDKYNHLAPIGVVGELVVGGDGVAVKYLNKESLTKEKFIYNHITNNGRLYKTGDLAYYTPEGIIEFLGRIDNQVKIRGFRIEPSEIEKVISTYPDIDQSIVLVKKHNNSKHLVSYFTSKNEVCLTSLRSFLEQKLPSYMIPSEYCQLIEIPITINGKVNKRSLLAKKTQQVLGSNFQNAKTTVERKLVEIWQGVLDVKQISVNDELYSLGGDSLKAMKILALVEKEFQIDIKVSQLIKNNTVLKLANFIENAESKKVAVIKKVTNREFYDTSSAQKRMYILSQSKKNSKNYNISLVKELRGKVDKDKIESCLNMLAERHEALRTSFILKDEKIMQVINPIIKINLQYQDLTNKESDINKHISSAIQTFDLSKAPLMRCKLIRIAENRHILVLDIHHIIADGTSIAIFFEEFSRLYKEEALPEIKVHYKDYASWQNSNIDSAQLISQKEYWINELANRVQLNLPTDFQRPSQQDFKGGRVSTLVNKNLLSKVKEIANQQGVTLYTMLLATYNILLSKYCRQDDILIGAAIANRTHSDTQDMIGMFVNTLAIRNYPSSQKTFLEFVSEVNTTSIKGFENQDYQFEKLIEDLQVKRDASRSVLIDSILVFQNTNTQEINIPNVEVTDYDFHNGTSKCDLTLEVIETLDGLKLNIEYSSQLYKKNTVSEMLNHFKNILNMISLNPNEKLGNIKLLTPTEEKKILLEFNKTKTVYPHNKTLVDLFNEQVTKNPNKTAVVCSNTKLSYKELSSKANYLANELISKGVKNNDIVAVLANRNESLIIAILAIIKSGAAYLPIDIDYPEERISFMLEHSKAKILLTSGNFNTSNYEQHVIDISNTSNDLDKCPLVNSSSQDLAYVLYTSGTTGKPKAVAVKKQNIIRLVKNTNYIDFKEEDSILQTGSVTFDASTFEIWGALLNGLTLHITSKDIILNATKLENYLSEHHISILWLTSPLFNKLCEENIKIFKPLRVLLVGGDVVSPKNVRAVQDKYEGITVVNGYGPTENTTFSTCYVMKNKIDTKSPIPIGVPIANSTAYILDECQNVVPTGVYGELYVGGDGLSLGYLHNEELTKEKFVINPFNRSERLYKTGDLVRYMPNGNIEFAGRIDFQVKIRGFRIEPAEIENNLVKLTGIKEAVVAPIDINCSKSLCAYYVSDKPMSTATIRSSLKDLLPDYMIPAYFVWLKTMPLNQNGKVNRTILPLPTEKSFIGSEFIKAKTEIEKELVKIWSSILNVSKISINDNFFTLGGHSLKAINLVAKVQKMLMVELTISEVFKHPTILQMALLIKTKKTIDFKEITRVKKADYYTVSSAQKRLFALNQISQNVTNYNVPVARLINATIDEHRVKKVLEKLINRHEALRTSFHIINDEIIQRVNDNFVFNLEIEKVDTDIIDYNNYIKQFIRPFNLAKAPLFRAKLINFSNKSLLIFDMHHIITDGESMSILFDEFSKLYEGKELENLSIQYKDFANWEFNILGQQHMVKKEHFWLKQFADDAPIIKLPYDYPRPKYQSFEGSSAQTLINKELTKQLYQFCEDNNVSLYMALLAMYKVLLARYSGQQDIVVGSPIAGRNHADLANMVGMFVNTLAIRTFPEASKTFIDYLNEVKDVTLQCYENQEYPFDKLVDKLDIKRDFSRNPLFDTMFILQNTAKNDIKLKDMLTSNIKVNTDITKFDLTVEAVEENDCIKLNIDYATRLLKNSTVNSLISHYIELIKQLVATPNTKLSDINIVTESEKKTIINEFNNTTTPYNSKITIDEMFRKTALKYSDRIAISFEGNSLTYSELSSKSDKLAEILVTKGVKKDSIVGICIDRSVEMIIAILAILKAGAAYMPMATDYPSSRIEYMLSDSNADMLLIGAQDISSIEYSGNVIDVTSESLYNKVTTGFASTHSSSDLAYIIYTSGSTGKPKGVMIEHHSVINLVEALRQNIYQNYSNQLNICLISPYVFDASVKQIFASLLLGHSLHIVPEDYRYIGEKLIDFYIDNSIDISDGTPSHLKLILGDNTNHLHNIPVKQFIIGGERLEKEVVNNLFSYFEIAPKITNIYGPTECCVDTSAYLVEKGKINDITNIPIGKPLANYQVYILNEGLKQQPIGVAGELCISGPGVARGYLNRLELTNKKFVNNPYNEGYKLYRTGDLARYLPNGNIEFLGRIDFQVKIRGYRIEIGEINSIIKEYDSIKDSLVLAKDNNNEQALVAYVVPNNKKDFNIKDLKSYLKDELPKYMIPTAFTILDAMPLNNNGKINRSALPQPDFNAQAELGEYIQPRNENEQKMAEIWQDTLGINKIGIDDDFFDLGGDSFKAIKLVRSISENLGVMQLFKNPTIRELSSFLSGDQELERTMLNELTKPVKDKDREVSLVCFPFGGGSAISYQPLANSLPKNYSLYAVELPGHDYSFAEEELATLEESARICLSEIKDKIKGPIVLYGHCLGATMATYMAYILQEEGIEVEGVIVGAMFPAPQIDNAFFRFWERIFPSTLTDKGNKDLLRAIGGLSDDISPKETEFIIRNLRHDSKECIKWYTSKFSDTQHTKFDAPITCIVGEGDRVTEFYEERYKEWEFFSDYVDLETVENGGHFFFKNQAEELSDIIKSKVSLWQSRKKAKKEVAVVKDKKIVKLKEHRRKHVRPSMQLFLTVAIFQILSEIGSILAFMGCSLWIFKQTGQLSGFAVMLLFRTLPEILILPFAGAIIDRISRRVVIIVGDIFATLGSLFLLIMIFNGSLELWHIYAFTTISSIAGCFRQPAYWAAITQITPKMFLAQANSVANFSLAIGGIIAALFSGIIMANLGLKGIMIIDFLSFAIAIVVLLNLRFPNTMFNRQEEPILKEIVGGIKFILKRHSMVAMVVFFIGTNFLLSIFDTTILPIIESVTTDKMYGVVNAFNGAGALFGAIMMLVTGGLRKRAKGMVGFVIPIAIFMIIGGLRPSPILFAISLFGVFASLNILDVHWRSLIQVKVGLDLQGRVFAVNRMMVSVFIPLSYLTASWMSDKLIPTLMNTRIFNNPVFNLIVAPGASRAMRITLFIAGLVLLVWSLIGIKYKPLINMDDILEDASVGRIAIKDKDKLQEIIDKKQGKKANISMD